jgi:hypothetical protein
VLCPFDRHRGDGAIGYERALIRSAPSTEPVESAAAPLGALPYAEGCQGSHDGQHCRGSLMSELEQVSIRLPKVFVEQLRAEARRIDRPVSFVARKWLLPLRAIDRAEAIDDQWARQSTVTPKTFAESGPSSSRARATTRRPQMRADEERERIAAVAAEVGLGDAHPRQVQRLHKLKQDQFFTDFIARSPTSFDPRFRSLPASVELIWPILIRRRGDFVGYTTCARPFGTQCGLSAIQRPGARLSVPRRHRSNDMSSVIKSGNTQHDANCEAALITLQGGIAAAVSGQAAMNALYVT